MINRGISYLIWTCVIVVLVFSSTLVIAQEGHPVSDLYTCSMHPQVRLPEPGNCPICSMPLIALKPKQKPPSREEVFTCSMHPQVRLPSSGSCPICSMPLIPATPETAKAGEYARIELSEQARAMATVETVALAKRKLSYVVNAVGKIAYDETSLATITARVDGYAERLFVNFTGVEVSEGDHLAEIYSPELVIAQQELIVANTHAFQETTKTKLRLLGLNEAQVNELAQRKKISERVTLFSPITGTVISRNITQNASFKAGDVLYQIANLDSIWTYLDIYESQIPWLRYGQHVTMTAESFPGMSFEGQVTFISPVVDETTRTLKVPVYIQNEGHLLKPGMFVSAAIYAELDSAAKPAPTGVEGRYTCPMHPQVVVKSQGSCPRCGMDLKKIPDLKEQAEPGPVLAVPVSAVLDSGKAQRVYVEVQKGTYEGRPVKLGPKAGEFYPVLEGLKEGERVAIRGNFLLDSQAQISGASSLFYPQGAAASPAHGQEEEPGPPSDTKMEEHSDHTHHGHSHH